jgi:hypothetical protein
MEFSFISSGPRGEIVKVVQFAATVQDDVFNLAFGDQRATEKGMDDFIITNNGDSRLVLATVAITVVIFTDQYFDCWVFAEGSTPARSRLYQMGISNHFDEIDELFEIRGLVGDEWEDFQKGVNYEAFAVKRR